MEKRANTKQKRGVPVWVAVLIGAGSVLLALILVVTVLLVVLLGAKTPDSPSAEEPTAAPVVTPAQQDPEPQTPTEAPELPTPAPIETEAPTEAPTEEPTEAPTEAPTATPAPTEVPDSFTFGGKTVKTGTKKIDGNKLGIDGKSKKLRHIPAEEVANLVALCPDLEELSLEYCYMDDYAPLGALTKLTSLKLSRCNEDGTGNAVKDIAWMKNLTALKTLYLQHNEISDLTPLSGLKSLTKLNLSYNSLENDDLKAIEKLTNLTELALYGLKKISDFSPLASLSKLTYLHIGYNSSLKSIKSLTGLSKLKSLRICKTKISDISCLKDFAALEKLDLSGCPIKFKDYYDLKNCKKLHTIILDHGDTDGSMAIDDMINNGYGFEIAYEW